MASTTAATSDTLKLDYDGEVPGHLRDILRFAELYVRVKVVRIARRRSASGQGWHVCVRLNRALPVQAVVALQAILGSDARREVFNLSRALVLDSVPRFWRDRWNVLYSSKMGVTSMLDLKKFGGEERELKKQKSLRAADLGDSQYAVLTIENVREVMAKRDPKAKDAKPEPQLVVEFTELPGYVYWANYSGIRKLVHGLGQEERDWFGERIVLEQRTAKNPRTKLPTKVLWVADSRTWASVIAEHDAAAKSVKPRKRAAKRATAKGAKKAR